MTATVTPTDLYEQLSAPFRHSTQTRCPRCGRIQAITARTLSRLTVHCPHCEGHYDVDVEPVFVSPPYYKPKKP